MEVRDAVEADAETLADLADAPEEVLRNVVHDRAVRVLVDGDEVVAFVSFDVRDGTVHVTQFGGDAEAIERLLEEPIRFASGEGFAVEVLVTAGDETMREAVEAAGFEPAGGGPSFGGEDTTRYRLEA